MATMLPWRPSGRHLVVSVVGDYLPVFELAVPCEVFGIRRAGDPGLELRAHRGRGAPRCDPRRQRHADHPAGRPRGDRLGRHRGDPRLGRARPLRRPRAGRRAARRPRARRPAGVGVHGRLRARRHRPARRAAATTTGCTPTSSAARHPAITVDPAVLYVDEGSILTSAGTAAGIDLCLHLVRRDLGAEAANTVARRMVVPPHRDGGQAQFVQTPVPPGRRRRPPRPGAHVDGRAPRPAAAPSTSWPPGPT